MVWPRKIKKKKMRAILFLEKVKDLSTTKTLLPLTSKLPLASPSPTTKLHESPSSSSATSSLPLALEGQGSFAAINQKKSHPSKGSLTTRSINTEVKINLSLVSLDLKLPLTSFSRRIQPIRSFNTRPQRQFFLQYYYGEVLVIHSFLQILLRIQILDMGSVGNQNLWPPYDSAKGCSQGICSIYCPQWCYLNFPPPPEDDDSGNPFSPLIIAIIVILAIAFLLVSYYTIVKRYCRRRNDLNTSIEPEENLDGTTRDQWAVASTGLDEAVIKTITVCKYKKGDGLIEGTECAVCLSEFQENESLRLLPKCIHAFHLPCIDTWLKSHSSCPLCRVDVNLTSPLPPPAPSSQTPSTLNLASLEVQRPDDLIFVVDDHGRDRSEEVVLTIFSDDNVRPKSPLQNVSTTQDSETRNDIIGTPKEDVIKFRRSISSGTFSSQRLLMISDILRIEEAYEGLQMESSSRRVLEEESKNNTNNNSRDWELMRSPVAMRRSISTGRFLFTVHNKGNNSIFPH